jgi:type IV secretory pathway VirJ component
MKPTSRALAALVASFMVSAPALCPPAHAQAAAGDVTPQPTNPQQPAAPTAAGPTTAPTAGPTAGPVDEAFKQAPAGYDSDMIQAPHVYRPEGAPAGVVFLISDQDGWGEADIAEARKLVASGQAVVGLDLPTYMKALEQPSDDEDCSYAVSDIEEISKRLQTGTGNDYHLPMVAGRGEGASLALAFAAQTPASTLAAVVAVDPGVGITLKRPLCTDTPGHAKDGRTLYDIPPGPLTQPVEITFTPAAPDSARSYADALKSDHPGIGVSEVKSDPVSALGEAVAAQIEARAVAEGPLALPVEEMPVEKPAFDTLAIFYSGDGGWRDIDREVGSYLQKAGVPVVGIDSLRYFWAERKPQETADDLSRLIRHYRKQWHVSHVILIGYSFGADILPESYDLLPASDQKHVALMSLMSLTHDRDYEVHVSGWLGLSSGAEADPIHDLEKVPDAIVQCIIGDGDDEDACHDLIGKRDYDFVTLSGGHHFDGDYQTVANHILRALKSRL